MRTYCSRVEIENGKKLRQQVDGFVEWYKKQYNDYDEVLQSKMADNLVYRKFIDISKKDDVLREYCTDYNVAFDTMLPPFCVADILCKHILSTYSYGPENIGDITGFKPEMAKVNWFKYKGDVAFLTQLLQDYFNQNNEGGDINLSVLLEDRNERSGLAHSGDFGLCMSLIRLYNVIRRMLIFLNEKYMPELAEFQYPDSISFDFQTLWGHFGFSDFENRTTVLIVGPLHDVSQSRLKLLANLPWNIVIDFDGNSKFGGLRSTVDNNIKTIVHDQLLNTKVAEGIAISEGLTEWLSCGDFLLPNPSQNLTDLFGKKTAFFTSEPRKGLRLYYKYIENILNSIFKKIKNQQNFVSILYLYHDSKLLESIIGQCEDHLSDFYSLTALYYWDKYECDDICKVGYKDYLISDYSDRFEIFSCNIGSLFNQLDEYKGNLPEKKTISNFVKELPTENGTEEISLNLQTRLQKYFEVLYMDAGEEDLNSKEDSIERFHLGEHVPWCAFLTGDVVKLISENEYNYWVQKIKTTLGKLPNINSDKIFYLQHEPGIGGSTMLRQIGWDFHKDFPVLIANKYEKNETKSVLRDLYDMHSKKGFLLLVDEQYTAIEDLEEDIKSLSRPCVMIVAKRTEGGRFGKQDLPLNVITDDATKQLRQIFIKKSPLPDLELERKDRDYNIFINQAPKMKSPFFIGLYYIERDFKHLDDYTEQVLRKINSRDEIKALGYIAMCDYYGKVSLPAIFINRILKINNSRMTWVQKNNDLNSVIYYGKVNNGTNCYISKHYLISEKLFKQCSQKLYNFSFEDVLDLWAKEFIDDVFKECEENYTENYKNILETIFTQNRNNIEVFSKDGGNENHYREDFSKLILDIPVSQKREALLLQISEKAKTLADRTDPITEPTIYMMAAHFYGHLSRLYSKPHSEIKNFEKAKESSEKALYYLEGCNGQDATIYHMHGEVLRLSFKARCREKVESLQEVTKDDFINFEDEIKDIRRYYDLSAATGGYVYATSSTILLLVDYLTDVYRIKNINSSEALNKLTSDQQLLRLEIEELIHRLDSEELDEKNYEFYRDLIDKYESGIMFNDFSQTIVYFQNRYDTLSNNPGNLTEVNKVRQGLINARIAKCRAKTKKGLTYFDYSSLPKKDIDAILDLLQEMFNYKISNENNYAERLNRCNAYNKWMNLAKFSSRSVDQGIIYALEWKDLASKETIKDPKPYYYLYVLYYLSVLEGNINHKKNIEDFKKLSYKYANPKGKGVEYIRDLLVQGVGMGRLCDSSVIEDWKNLTLKRNVQLVPLEGRFETEESKKGFVALTEPIKWLHECAKFQTSDNNSLTKDACTHMVKFYGGFSYETISAINSSVKDITSNEKLSLPKYIEQDDLQIPDLKHKATVKKHNNLLKTTRLTEFSMDSKMKCDNSQDESGDNLKRHNFEEEKHPSIGDKVVLKELESVGNKILGKFEYEGLCYQGIIPNLTNKMLRIYKNKKGIMTKIIDFNGKQYILKI